MTRIFITCWACGLLPQLGSARAEVGVTNATSVKTEHFDSDPEWEGYRNRLLPEPPPITRQDFGYSATTDRAGGERGEIGGRAQRSTTPAYYAMKTSPKSFNDKLKASGKFSVTYAEGGSGLLFGWFHNSAKGWRTANSLVFRLDGNGEKYWVLFEYGTRNWHAGGMGCFEGEAYQTTKTRPFAADGSVHEWVLEYDPEGNRGSGAITFTLDGQPYTVNVRPKDRADGLELNRFGMLNTMLAGSAMEAWFDDLTVDGQEIDFRDDPHWDAKGNRSEFQERAIRPLHDIGYVADSNFAGDVGKGEVGGVMWRDELPAYYAAKTENLTLDDELVASGTLAFTGAGSDSGVCFGWFDSRSKRNQLEPEIEPSPKNAMAILIEGPSRIGHYFRPYYFDSSGEGGVTQDGPIIRPDGKVHAWRLRYDPAGAAGNGRITFKLDDDEQSVDLPPGAKQAGAVYDRFGIFNHQRGGSHVSVYFDDLEFTAAPQPHDAGASDPK